MSENKYNPYVSQQPTDGDSSTRAFRRRQWKNNWDKFLAQEDGMNYRRDTRRMVWKFSWSKFKCNNLTEVES
jgi:hypothetical protein